MPKRIRIVFFDMIKSSRNARKVQAGWRVSRIQYFSKFSSMNLGYSTTLTNHRSTETTKNRTNRDKYEFIPESFPNEQPEEIKPE